MNTIEKNSLKVGKYVSTEHVDTLVRNYKKDRWIQNSERIGKEDNIGVWLSADELEEFVQNAKMYGANGICLYFGVYGEKCPKPGMEGKQTVALVATTSERDENNNLVHEDLYVERDGKETLMAYNLMWPLPPTTTTTPTTLKVGSVMIADKNKGLQII